MVETSPVSVLRGVGDKVEKALGRLGIHTVGELLRHIPSGYDDYTTALSVATSRSGQSGYFTGYITNLTSRRSHKKRGLVLTEAVFSDDTGSAKIVWFNRFPMKNIPTDALIKLTGIVEKDGGILVRNPIVEQNSSTTIFAGRLVPRYPLTAGVTQGVLRALVRQVIGTVVIHDAFPVDVQSKYSLLSLPDALSILHAPLQLTAVDDARRRLAFDELLYLQLAQKLQREQREASIAPSIGTNELDMTSLRDSLPYRLTDEQAQVLVEILDDIKQSRPMHRLLQGEVGSGKTVIATLAAATVVRAGYQVLYLAPTEVLAVQQYDTLQALIGKNIKVALLTRSQQMYGDLSSKKEVIAKIALGEPCIVVGTHATLQESVVLPNIGFAIVDEQHRFGVLQRFTARQRGQELQPHVLSMSATPIPRTLQLAFMGDLDISTLHFIPTGERKVKTFVVDERQRTKVEKRLCDRVKEGQQAYVVCPLIDASEVISAKAALVEYERLRSGVLKEVSVGYVHGKMSGDEKSRVIGVFRRGEISVLVATSVVEVGIDVPNASTIIIEGAERFGLAQLHQLRGRVGRSGQEGYCLLFTSVDASPEARHRLEQFSNTKTGFELSELDLSLRGPGEWFGVRQSGYPDFTIATLDDHLLLEQASSAAKSLIEKDKTLRTYPDLLQRIERLVNIASQA